ncbi:MAG: hypothetical protein VZS44_00360 [Bacilli bacterium]|nr:hypothetical protein [Bacilli bacterium]
MNNQIMGNLLNFFAVAVVFLVILVVFFGIYSKKFKITERNASIYGLFLDLDNRSLIAIASLTINYLFLVWCSFSFTDLNIIYAAIIILLVMVSDIVLDDFKKMFIDLLLSFINLGAIKIIYIIFNYINKEAFSYILLLTLFLLILFVFLYYTYNLFRQLNNIVVNNKYLKNKKYKL